MKLLPTLLIISTLTLNVDALAQREAVYLQTKINTKVKSTTTNWKTDYGSTDKDYSRSMSITINLRNMQTDNSRVRLEWYFVAKDLSNKKQWIFDYDAQEIEIDEAIPIVLIKTSNNLEASVQRYVALNERSNSGSKIDGYIVRVTIEDRILAVNASSKPLEKVARENVSLRDVFVFGSTE